MKASDLSARLLATENLSVIRARTRTASFDIKSRVLTLPMWKDMTPEIEDMLVGHEVGHALYTGEEYMQPIQENHKMMGYLNIIEDVRIEKLIKRKYPGLRKRMNEGYKQLNDRDFFGIKQVPNLDSLLLIDKINLYFKAGFQCGVKFDADEKEFVNRAERTETIDDVIQLAQDIYTFSKQKAEERKERMKQENPQDVEDDEEEEDPIYGDFDIDMDGDWDSDEDEDTDLDPRMNKAPKQQNDERSHDDENDLESQTERVFRNKLEELADENTMYKYWRFDKDYDNNPVIGYKKILSETRTPEQWNAETSNEYYDRITRYMSEEEKAEYFKNNIDKFSLMESLGNCWIDEELKKIPLPTNMRSMNFSTKPIIRGQRVPLDNPDAKVIRPFVHWMDKRGSEDLDLSVTFVGEKVSEVLSFSNLRVGNSCHSGDVRHRQGPCAEYIDIDIKDALSRGFKYGVIDVRNYNGGTLSSLETSFGIMEREHPESNKTWLPETISNCQSLESESSNTLIAIIDFETKEYIMLDIDSSGFVTARSDFKNTLKVIQQYAELPKVSVYDLILLHVEGRGKQVTLDENVDTHFKYEDFCYSYEETGKLMGV